VLVVVPWESFVTTKDAYYTSADVVALALQDTDICMVEFRLPSSCLEYDRIGVLKEDLVELT
jgi:hypothetical protein